MTLFRLEPNRRDYSPASAVTFGYAALWAYDPPGPGLTGKLQRLWALPNVRILSDPATHTQGFVAGNESVILVAFRGTEPNQLQDWATDLEFRFRSTPMGRAHQGFSEALDGVWDQVLDALREFRTNGQSLWFTGHSLGAALANLSVARLAHTPGFEALPSFLGGIYTFGQPRVGNRVLAGNFNRLFRDRFFRFVNNNDVVARVPPRSFGYSHMGRPVYFTQDGRLTTDRAWWAGFRDRMKGRFEGFLLLRPDEIADHSMDAYVTLLEESSGSTPVFGPPDELPY